MKYLKEILLTEAIIFILLWITNEYLATLLTFIAVPVFFSILVISMISEFIEKSKVGRDYFILMFGLAILPALVFILMYFINGGYGFDWARQ